MDSAYHMVVTNTAYTNTEYDLTERRRPSPRVAGRVYNIYNIYRYVVRKTRDPDNTGGQNTHARALYLLQM